MKLIRSILRYSALILVLGGLIVMFMTYITKKEILMALVSNTIVKSSMSVLRTLAICVGAIVIGMLLFMLSMRLSSSIRKYERERDAELREKEKENRETNRRLQQEAEEAKAEAEKIKKENELMRQTFMGQPKEEETEKTEEEQA